MSPDTTKKAMFKHEYSLPPQQMNDFPLPQISRHESKATESSNDSNSPHSQSQSPQSYTSVSSVDSPPKTSAQIPQETTLNSVPSLSGTSSFPFSSTHKTSNFGYNIPPLGSVLETHLPGYNTTLPQPKVMLPDVGSTALPNMLPVGLEPPRKLKYLRKSNDDDSDGPLRCKWGDCTECYDNAELLYNHMCDAHVGRKSKRNLNLTCGWEDCGVSTLKRDHITSHIRVHIPLKPFVCGMCTKKFKRPQDLKKHEKTHVDAATRSMQKAQQAAQSQHMQTSRNGWSSQLGHYTTGNNNSLLDLNTNSSTQNNFMMSMDFENNYSVGSKRKPEMVSQFFDDVKKSKMAPRYNNEMASKLTSLDFNLNNDLSLPPLSTQGSKLFKNNQELYDTSSFFNQLSASLDQYTPSTANTSNSNSTFTTAPAHSAYTLPTINNSVGSTSLYPSLSSGPGNFSYPQIANRLDSQESHRRYNIGINQKTSAHEVLSTDDSESDSEFDDGYEESESEYEDEEMGLLAKQLDAMAVQDPVERHKAVVRAIQKQLKEMIEDAEAKSEKKGGLYPEIAAF